MVYEQNENRKKRKNCIKYFNIVKYNVIILADLNENGNNNQGIKVILKNYKDNTKSNNGTGSDFSSENPIFEKCWAAGPSI